MKKIIAVAALVVAGFAAPTATVQAASAYPSNCLVLPLLQSECRDVIASNMGAAAKATAKVATATAADVKRPKVVGGAWWTCKAAPAGSKAMYSCDY